jgi:hypothetical protein
VVEMADHAALQAFPGILSAGRARLCHKTVSGSEVRKMDRGFQGNDGGECRRAEHQRDGSLKSTRMVVSREVFDCIWPRSALRSCRTR